MKYEIIENEFYKFIKRTDKNKKIWLIPFDEANSDYEEYLAYTAWVEEGKKPEDFWNQPT
jgi:hypothetical protein